MFCPSCQFSFCFIIAIFRFLLYSAVYVCKYVYWAYSWAYSCIDLRHFRFNTNYQRLHVLLSIFVFAIKKTFSLSSRSQSRVCQYAFLFSWVSFHSFPWVKTIITYGAIVSDDEKVLHPFYIEKYMFTMLIWFWHYVRLFRDMLYRIEKQCLFTWENGNLLSSFFNLMLADKARINKTCIYDALKKSTKQGNWITKKFVWHLWKKRKIHTFTHLWWKLHHRMNLCNKF